MRFLERLAVGAAQARNLLPGQSKSVSTQSGSSSDFVQLFGPTAANWGRRDYPAFASDGMMNNPIVYRSIRMIAEAVASCDWKVAAAGSDAGHVGWAVDQSATDLEAVATQVLTLLRSPADDTTANDLIEAWVTSLLVSGDAFLHASYVQGRACELHLLRSDRVTVLADRSGQKTGYSYDVGSERQIYSLNDGENPSAVLHVNLCHPLNDHRGLSPLHAAAAAIDIHNSAAAWNKALLDNAARPSGALVYSAAGGSLTDDQYTRLKGELETTYQGARNAGRPLLLEGGLDWKSMGFSPRDMDFIEAKNAAAREIALALGVPPMLLGVPGDATYANYQEANRTFWRQTVLPLARRFGARVGAWVGPAFGAAVQLVPDLDELPVFASERGQRWERLSKADFISANEKRAALGFPPIEGGDAVESIPATQTPSEREVVSSDDTMRAAR